MPQRPTAIQALLGGLATGAGQGLDPYNQYYLQRQQQRQQEQETKARAEQRKPFEQNLKLAIDEFGKESVQASGYRQIIMEMNTGMPAGFDPTTGAQLTPLQQRASEFGRGIGPDFQRAQEQKALEAEQTKAREARAEGPSAGTISMVRRGRDKFAEIINTSTTDIERMREMLNLAPGEKPTPERTWFGFGAERKKQPALKQWDRLHGERERAQTSLDNLQQAAEKSGITKDVFELGAITVQPYQIGIEDPLGMRK